MNLRPPAHSVRNRHRGPAGWAVAFAASAQTAMAAASPSVDVVGSYFPAWLICIVIGLVLTIAVRLLFVAWKLNTHLFAAPIVYSCLTAIFAMSVWLILFRN